MPGRLAARRMLAVDERAEREQRDVLDEGAGECEPPRLDGGSLPQRVEREAADAVRRVHRDPDDAWLRSALAALVAHVRTGRGRRLAVERFDGEPVAGTEALALLVEAAFPPAARAVLRP